MTKGLDHYVVKARLRPALLVLLPISITILSFNPDGIVGWPGLIALIFQAGGAFLLANLAGDAGKAKEEMLFAEGRPTELMLSHAQAPNPIERQLRHQKLSRLFPTVRLPTPEEEAADFKSALKVYAAVVDQLRPKIRNMPLVFAENCHFGFRRNVWGMSFWGFWAAFICLGVQVAEIIGRVVIHGRVEPISVIAAVITGGLVILWWYVFTPKWVMRAAKLYANRYLEGLDSLEDPR